MGGLGPDRARSRAGDSTSAGSARWLPDPREVLGGRRVLVVAGEGAVGGDDVLDVAAALGWPVIAEPTSGLRLPVLGIAGSDDGSTPPDLVRETVDLVPGSRFQLIRRAGHLPFVEQPQAYSEALTSFLRDIGHI